MTDLYFLSVLLPRDSGISRDILTCSAKVNLPSLVTPDTNSKIARSFLPDPPAGIPNPLEVLNNPLSAIGSIATSLPNPVAAPKNPASSVAATASAVPGLAAALPDPAKIPGAIVSGIAGLEGLIPNPSQIVSSLESAVPGAADVIVSLVKNLTRDIEGEFKVLEKLWINEISSIFSIKNHYSFYVANVCMGMPLNQTSRGASGPVSGCPRYSDPGTGNHPPFSNRSSITPWDWPN